MNKGGKRKSSYHGLQLVNAKPVDVSSQVRTQAAHGFGTQANPFPPQCMQRDRLECLGRRLLPISSRRALRRRLNITPCQLRLELFHTSYFIGEGKATFTARISVSRSSQCRARKPKGYAETKISPVGRSSLRYFNFDKRFPQNNSGDSGAKL